MQVRFISVPYDLGRYDSGMGKGPGAILDNALIEQLKNAGHVVDQRMVLCPDFENLSDLQTTFRLNTLISQAVAQAIVKGFFPIVLAGNCITTVGVFSGLQDKHIGVLWLDAHGDFNTPETTPTGYLDGMALSVACGRCWKTLTTSDPSYLAISEDQVVLLGTRDLDPAEIHELKASRVSLVTVADLRRKNWKIPEIDRSRIRDLYIHFDADVLDIRIGRANRFASENGLLPDDVSRILSRIAEDFRLKAITLTAYHPESDREGTVRRELRGIILSVVNSVSASRENDK